MPATPKHQIRTRRQTKASQRYQDAKARQKCVNAVWERAGSKCERCGRGLLRGHSFGVGGHVHEKLARSLGGDPTDPNGCELLCVPCHMPSGAHRRSVRASA